MQQQGLSQREGERGSARALSLRVRACVRSSLLFKIVVQHDVTGVIAAAAGPLHRLVCPSVLRT